MVVETWTRWGLGFSIVRSCFPGFFGDRNMNISPTVDLLSFNSWIGLFQIDQRWISTMHITCWQRDGKVRKTQLLALPPERHTGSSLRKHSTWTGPAYWRSRTSHPLLLRVFQTTSHHLFTNRRRLLNRVDTFLRWVYLGCLKWVLHFMSYCANCA